MNVEIIYGPPGTGKTTKLLSILEHELEVLRPEEIAYVSFTRKGTYEGKERACQKFNLQTQQLPYFRTIHSLAFRALGMSRNDMISKEHYRQFSEALGMNFTGYYTEDLAHDDDRYLFFSKLYRNNPSIGESLVTDLNPKLLDWVTRNYTNFKHALGIYDFTDLLELYLEEGEPFPVKAVIIDEAQDLTTLQWKFVWKAFCKVERVYIAGDDDQAIYEWSGADVDYFLKLKGSQQVLSKSWRLPQAVHGYASQIASCITNRIDKEFTYNEIRGSVTKLNSFNEVTIDNESSWLFLSRNNYNLNKVESWIKSKALIYQRRGKNSNNMDIVKAINAHTAKCRGEAISSNCSLLLQFYMFDSETHFKKPWFEEFGRLKKDTITYYRDLIGQGTELNKCNITISTIHGAKGGEADNVVLLLDINKRVAQNLEQNFDSEMRCYYVGVTRAKKNLYIVLPSGPYGYKYFGGCG
jgi:superfamily I DNA/RNA helicase